MKSIFTFGSLLFMLWVQKSVGSFSAEDGDQYHYYQSVTIKFTNYTQTNNLRYSIIKSMWDVLVEELQTNQDLTFKYLNLAEIHENSSEMPDIYIDFFQYLDSDISSIYHQDAFPYNPAQYTLSEHYLEENYVFVKPTKVLVIVKAILLNSAVMILVIMLPWYLLNLNLLALFILKLNPSYYYYEKIVEALKFMIGTSKQYESTGQLIFRIIFGILNMTIIAIILTDSIYIVAQIIQKTRIQNTYDLINNLAKPCFLADKAFVSEILQLHREIDYFTGETIQDCLDMVSNNEADAALFQEFNLLNYLFQQPDIMKQFLYRIKQNSKTQYSLLVSNDLPPWFLNELNSALQRTSVGKRDTEIRNTFIPKGLYQSTSQSFIMSNTNVLLGFSIFFFMMMLLIQIKTIFKEITTYNETVQNVKGESDKQKYRNEQNI